jgi:large subunit ribosomal protein L24
MTLHRQPQKPVRINLHKDDNVIVITGKDAGKTGKILQVIPDKNRLVVQGVSFLKKHTKPNPQRNIKGGIAEREGTIHASNVMLVCSECGKRTRIAHKIMDDGKKIRVCSHRECKGALDK